MPPIASTRLSSRWGLPMKRQGVNCYSGLLLQPPPPPPPPILPYIFLPIYTLHHTPPFILSTHNKTLSVVKSLAATVLARGESKSKQTQTYTCTYIITRGVGQIFKFSNAFHHKNTFKGKHRTTYIDIQTAQAFLTTPYIVLSAGETLKTTIC